MTLIEYPSSISSSSWVVASIAGEVQCIASPLNWCGVHLYMVSMQSDGTKSKKFLTERDALNYIKSEFTITKEIK